MSNLCNKVIESCISASCENPIFKGIESIGYVFNKSEIEDFTYEYDKTTNPTGNPNVITEINMASHTVGGSSVDYTGFEVKQLGKTPFTGTNTAMAEGNVMNTFTETVTFVVPDNSPAAAMLLDNIAGGKFVFVLQNEYTGADGRGSFQVFGAKKGLVCTAMERDAYSDDTNGGWSVTLTAEGCPNSALFLEHTDTSGDTPVVDTAAYIKTITDDCD